jgi:hypothetical protein
VGSYTALNSPGETPAETDEELAFSDAPTNGESGTILVVSDIRTEVGL